MSLQDSPSFDHVIYPESEQSPAPVPRKKNLRWLIAGLVMVLLVLTVVNFWGSGVTDALRGKGSISGFVVDQDGNAVKAEVLVAGTGLGTFSDETGQFLLGGIPEGQRTLVVGYGLTGWEYPITVIAGQTMELGRISVIATATP